MLAVPNVSDGNDAELINRIGDAASSVAGVKVLDVHSDRDHHRSVFTLSGPPGCLHPALMALAATAVAGIDIVGHRGVHPRVGAVDVVPVVYIDERQRGAACAEALTVADRLGSELGLPVFLYGPLTAGRVTRAMARSGGVEHLQARIDAGELTPDFGPRRVHPTAGAVLVAARPPLVAFNIELAPPAGVDMARRIAALIREGGEEGLPSLRAIGLELAHRGGVAQISMNIEDHEAISLGEVVAAISRHARPASAELVGLAPRAAFDGFPADLPIANRRYIEDVLAG